MEYRTEHDSMGEIAVEAGCYWGTQTERSRNCFRIGVGAEQMPREILQALFQIKKAAAIANAQLIPDRITEEKKNAVCAVCDELLSGALEDQFPLTVWQTGSGTQTNMNVNEVIANRANEGLGKKLLHPNDDVNCSQSSNDVFPSAMHIAARIALTERVLPALDALIAAFSEHEQKAVGIYKCGRTHLQDAVPMTFSQEISGWRASLEQDRRQLADAGETLAALALGGTAVGTGLNAPRHFDRLAAEIVSKLTQLRFHTAENKFHALSSKGELVFVHGALKTLAVDLLKIANDVRWLASGPRLGLGELSIPANEPGSSIMPGKVNPTQCEALSMVAVQVMGNDAAIGIAASQGNFQLNVYMPVMAYQFLQSARLLADAMTSFRIHCIAGMHPNTEQMHANMQNSLMLVTALNPYIGYERSAQVANLALREKISLREACIRLGILTSEQYFQIIQAAFGNNGSPMPDRS